jgi:hypothetical protein
MGLDNTRGFGYNKMPRRSPDKRGKQLLPSVRKVSKIPYVSVAQQDRASAS